MTGLGGLAGYTDKHGCLRPRKKGLILEISIRISVGAFKNGIISFKKSLISNPLGLGIVFRNITCRF